MALHITAAVLSQNDDDFVANVFCEATALRITVASTVKKLTIFLRGDIVSPVGVFCSFVVVAADAENPAQNLSSRQLRLVTRLSPQVGYRRLRQWKNYRKTKIEPKRSSFFLTIWLEKIERFFYSEAVWTVTFHLFASVTQAQK